MVSYSFIYILTFIITALWDIVLRFLSENYDTLPSFGEDGHPIFYKPLCIENTLDNCTIDNLL